MTKRFLKQLSNPHLAAAVLLAVAVILFLLISISAPVVEGNHLFRLTTVINIETNLKQYVDYGLWGYCIPHMYNDHSNVDQGCRMMFGLEVDDNVVAVLNANTALRSILEHKPITRSFILFPFATFLTFITCCFQIWLYVKKALGYRFSLCAQGRTLGRLFGFGSFSMLVSIVASAALLVVIAKAKVRASHLRDTYGNIYLEWGNLTWLTVLATIIHFANLINLFVMRLKLARIELELQSTRTRRKRHRHPRRMNEEIIINPPLPLSATPSSMAASTIPSDSNLVVPDSPPKYQPALGS